MWVVWLVAALLFVVVQVNLRHFYTIQLAVSALLALLFERLEFGVWSQLGIFFGTAIVFNFLIRAFIRRRVARQTPEPHHDLVGQKGVVVRDINHYEGGQVQVGDDVWSAFAEEAIAKGETVKIVTAEPSRLYVRRGN
ncbi:MAG TPA: NfeD family protein [Bacilli bacterium]|nr:NfeD family protein [Bacilli bacterium]